MASGTDGNLITYDASGDPAYVTTGSSGEVLTSNGAGTTPTFQAAAGGGKILQVISTTKTDTFTTSSTSFTDVTGLSATITPSATSSKILVIFQTQLSNSNGGARTYIKLVRASTDIYIGDTSGVRKSLSGYWKGPSDAGILSVSGTHRDEPNTTSATTYKIQMSVGSNTGTLNRGGDDANYDSNPRAASSITLMEIGA
jgi:hypothetical protein